MSAKILIVGLPMTGKTTLLQSLEEVFVIAHDGKKYPFLQPHTNINVFANVDELISVINEKLGVYMDKNDGKLPKTIAFDSVSKIFLTIEGNCLATVKSFPYGVVNTEIKKFVDYIENELVSRGINVVLVSHAMNDEESGAFKLVNAGGSYAKKGGFLSEVDHSVFVEAKSNKRIVHYRSLKFISRTTLHDLPDNVPSTEYNLQEHINKINAVKEQATEFEY